MFRVQRARFSIQVLVSRRSKRAQITPANSVRGLMWDYGFWIYPLLLPMLPPAPSSPALAPQTNIHPYYPKNIPPYFGNPHSHAHGHSIVFSSINMVSIFIVITTTIIIVVIVIITVVVIILFFFATWF